MKNTGLTSSQINSIKEVFAKYPAVQEVVLYGSRAMGNFKPASDIDLAIKGAGINLGLQNKIELDLDDLMLPYKMDVSVYHKISNPELRNHIDRVGQEIYNHKDQQNNASATPKNG